MVARLLAAVALLLSLSFAGPVAAQDEPRGSSLEGSWALQLGSATIFRFDMAPVAGKPGEWEGAWSRPQKFATDGNRFSQLVLPPKVTFSMAGLEAEGGVELSFNDPRPGAVPDIFRFRLIDADAAEMTYVGTDLAPYIVYRVKPETPLGPFAEDAVYERKVAGPPAASEPAAPPSGPPASGSSPRAAPPVPPVDANGYRLPPKGTPTR